MIVRLSLDPRVKPVACRLATPGRPENGYVEVTVSARKMARLLADPSKHACSLEDCMTMLHHAAEQGDSSEARRNAAAAVERFTAPGGLLDEIRRLEDDPAALALVDTDDEEFQGWIMVSEAERSTYRRNCLSHNFELIELKIHQARESGDVNPIAMVLDTSDPRVWGPFESFIEVSPDVKARVEKGHGANGTALIGCVMQIEDALERLALLAPEVAREVLAPAPGGGYWAVVLAAGGAEAFPMPELP